MLFVLDANMLVSDLLLTFALFTQLLTLPAGLPLPPSEVGEIEDSKPFAPSSPFLSIHVWEVLHAIDHTPLPTIGYIARNHSV